MRNAKLYEMIKEGWKVEDVRRELDLLPSDLRALVMVFKRMGIGVHRSGSRFTIRELPVSGVTLRTPIQVVTATVQATKVLRFLYGEDVKMVWPNAVTLGNESIVTIEGPQLRVNGLDRYLESAIIKRTRDALRRNKIGEVISAANVLLYKDKYRLFLKGGEVIETKVRVIGLDGRAKTDIGDIEVEEVSGIGLIY